MSSDFSDPLNDDVIKKYYETIMDLLQIKFQNNLIFIGIVQDGKLLEFRRGIRKEFALPPQGQDALDVKLSLLMDLVRTLETVIGAPRVLTVQFQNLDMVVVGISQKRFMYTLSIGSSADKIAYMLKAVGL